MFYFSRAHGPRILRGELEARWIPAPQDCVLSQATSPAARPWMWIGDCWPAGRLHSWRTERMWDNNCGGWLVAGRGPFLPPGFTLEVFGWVLGFIVFTLGAHWVPSGHYGAAGFIFGNFRLRFWRPWKFLGSTLRSPGVTLDALGIQNGCCRPSGWHGKHIWKHMFFMVSEGWRDTLETSSTSRLRCWMAGWQLAGRLTGWLVLAHVGWEACRRRPPGPQGLRQQGQEECNFWFWCANKQTLIKRTSNCCYSTRNSD